MTPSDVAVSPTAERPLVSVIVPSHNMGRFLPATLDSIISQDYRPLEVVVVDGASPDETVEILREYSAAHPELRWISEPDDGPADAVNRGLEMIRGSIAAIQSADDVYHPGAVRAAVEAFAAHPQAGIVYGDAEVIDAEGHATSVSSFPGYTLRRYLCGATFTHQSSTFFRPELARSVGGCRPEYFTFDTDLWIRMLFRAPAHKIDQVLSAYRRHDRQRDKHTAQILTSYRRMLRDSPEVAAAPWRTRRAARAGERMIVQFYNPRSGWYRTGQVWLGLLTYPPAIRGLDTARVLIGPLYVRRGLQRLAELGRRLRHGTR